MNETWLSFLKPRAWVAKLLLALFALGFLALGFLDYLQPIKEFLDSERLSFRVGDARFSVYIVTKFFLILIVLIWVTGILSEFLEKRIQSVQSMREGNKALFTKIAQILIYFIAFIVALEILGIDLTSLAIFSGAIGIGIGFGLQKITSNFISGLILLFEKSVENGDLVEVHDTVYGFIRKTGARFTLIETFDGKEVMIPNEDFITNRVVNWTFNNSKGRIAFTVGVSYNSDIEKARELMIEAASEHPRCMQDPGPVCFLREFGDSSVNFLLYFWVEDVTQGRYTPQSQVMLSIWRKFKENNITIPFPQRDLHIKKDLESFD